MEGYNSNHNHNKMYYANNPNSSPTYTLLPVYKKLPISPFITFIFGHRGASGYEVPNTLESFKLAIEMGADGVESDVQKTEDNHIIFHHNSTILYHGYPRSISTMTLEEVQSIDLGAGRHIPTVESVFEYFKGRVNNYGYPICYSLDIKDMDNGTGEALVTLAHYLGVAQNIFLTIGGKKYAHIYHNISNTVNLVNSTDIWAIPPGCIPALCPGIYTSGVYFKHWDMLQEANYCAINVSSNECSGKIIADVRSHNFNMWVYDCNTVEVIDKYLADKVDVIMSNYPDIAVSERFKFQLHI